MFPFSPPKDVAVSFHIIELNKILLEDIFSFNAGRVHLLDLCFQDMALHSHQPLAVQTITFPPPHVGPIAFLFLPICSEFLNLIFSLLVFPSIYPVNCLFFYSLAGFKIFTVFSLIFIRSFIVVLNASSLITCYVHGILKHIPTSLSIYRIWRHIWRRGV